MVIKGVGEFTDIALIWEVLESHSSNCKQQFFLLKPATDKNVPSPTYKANHDASERIF